jgi:flagellar motility protein MotE (MotC chaperone)
MTAKKKEMSKKEKAELEETLGDAAELEGVLDVAEGMDDLAVASDLEEMSKDVMAAGVSDMTRGVDEMVVADRAAVLSDVVSVAGVIDFR